MLPETRHPAHERADEQCRQHEGRGHPDAIGQQKQPARRCRFCAGGGEQDRRQDRADARRPAKGKGQPDDISPPKAGRGGATRIRAKLAVQKSDADHPQKMQPHCNNNRRRNPSQNVKVITHDLAKGGRCRAEPHKDRDHPSRKKQRRDHRATPYARVNRPVCGDLVHANPRQIAQVEWDNRQNAGR